jgi:hypothetical protein
MAALRAASLVKTGKPKFIMSVIVNGVAIDSGDFEEGVDTGTGLGAHDFQESIAHDRNLGAASPVVDSMTIFFNWSIEVFGEPPAWAWFQSDYEFTFNFGDEGANPPSPVEFTFSKTGTWSNTAPITAIAGGGINTGMFFKAGAGIDFTTVRLYDAGTWTFHAGFVEQPPGALPATTLLKFYIVSGLAKIQIASLSTATGLIPFGGNSIPIAGGNLQFNSTALFGGAIPWNFETQVVSLNDAVIETGQLSIPPFGVDWGSYIPNLTNFVFEPPSINGRIDASRTGP